MYLDSLNEDTEDAETEVSESEVRKIDIQPVILGHIASCFLVNQKGNPRPFLVYYSKLQNIILFVC